MRGVSGVAPFTLGSGMLMQNGRLVGVSVVGIEPRLEKQVSRLAEQMEWGQVSDLQSGSFHVILGHSLAENLGVGKGSRLNLVTPRFSHTLLGVFPVYKTLTVSGIFKAGAGFGFEDSLIYISESDAKAIYPLPSGLSGLHVKLTNLYTAPLVAQRLATQWPFVAVQDWTEQAGAFFGALKMEKTMLFVILSLIVAVAVFNLVSTLVMVVNEKRADLGILRTLGANRATLVWIFIFQGMLISSVGIVMGMLGGILLAHYAPWIVDVLQRLFEVQFLNENVFFLNYLPSKIEMGDVMKVVSVAWVLGILATLYPARLALQVNPIEALRYE
jgi:lipoprotein-releasing system permease protein